MAAAHAGQTECVALLSAASDARRRDILGREARELTLWSGDHPETLGALLGGAVLAPEEAIRLLFCCVQTNSAESLEFLLPLCDPKALNEEGRSALSHAVIHRSEASFRLLLPLSDARQADSDGGTPLIFAAGLGEQAMREALAPLSDIDACDNAGSRACAHALHMGHAGVADFLGSQSQDDVFFQSLADEGKMNDLPRALAHFEARALRRGILGASSQPAGASAETEQGSPSASPHTRRPPRSL